MCRAFSPSILNRWPPSPAGWGVMSRTFGPKRHAMLAARGNAIVITNFCHLAAKFIYLRFDKDHTKSHTALVSLLPC
jgi:hypothetical protein